MSMYFGATEITNFDNLAPAQGLDITGLYFGDKECFTVWAEYDGTLPAQYSANGSTLADYRIYGAAGGVGDRTVNIFSYDMIDVTTEGTYINTNGGISYSQGWFITEYIPVSDAYATIKGVLGNAAVIAAYDSNKTLLRVVRYANTSGPKTINLLNAAYVRFSIYPADQTEVMLVYGITAPESYVPYGYKVDMVCGENLYNENTTVDGQRIYWATGGVYYDSDAAISDYISVQAGDTYVFTNAVFFIGYSAGNVYLGAWTGSEFEKNGEMPERKDITVPSGCVKIRLTTKDKALLHGDVKLTHGAVTPIYIGSSPLDEDECVGYGEGKIYRMSGGILTPTDPPVPLPALPTVDGTTITDYAGQSVAVPSRFVAKYRKEGF